MRRSLLSTAAVGTLLLSAACGAPEEPEGAPVSTDHAAAGTQGEGVQEEGPQDEEAQQEPEHGAADDGDAAVSEASWDPASIHVLVNKANPLEPSDHVPSDLTVPEVPAEHEDVQLRAEPAAALEELFAAASAAEIPLVVTSAYRAYDLQSALYSSYADSMGQEAADEVSARPGHSEHQTGLAVDLSYPGNEDCYLKACFGQTPTGIWLEENAHEHGFIIRYPEESQEITGFSYEPWHLRYVSEATASDVISQGVTLEEYWGQPAAPDYEDA